ncbi:MAG: PIN domain nuclease [Phycisphaerales bacterium]|nr:PIN domain nuclease [Phycisphaerales bacterium]
MILVDSSVWIEYFGPGKTPVCDQLEDLISDGQIIAVTGVIIQEVLQGTHSEQQMMQLKKSAWD